MKEAIISLVDEAVWDAFEQADLERDADRIENLTWKENQEGILLAGDDRNIPETVVAFERVGASIEATVLDEEDRPTSQEWARFRTHSQPETNTSPQFD